MATDDLHAPLGLGKPAAGRPIVHSVAAAVLGIATAAVVIGAGRLVRTARPQPAEPRRNLDAAGRDPLARPEPAMAASAPAHPVSSPAASRHRISPQVTGAIPPAGGLDGKASSPPGQAGRAGQRRAHHHHHRRQERRPPGGADSRDLRVQQIAPLPDPGFSILMRGDTVLGADDAPEPLPAPPRAKPSAPQKRAATKPGPTLSTNSASQAPLR